MDISGLTHTALTDTQYKHKTHITLIQMLEALKQKTNGNFYQLLRKVKNMWFIFLKCIVPEKKVMSV